MRHIVMGLVGTMGPSRSNNSSVPAHTRDSCVCPFSLYFFSPSIRQDEKKNEANNKTDVEIPGHVAHAANDHSTGRASSPDRLLLIPRTPKTGAPTSRVAHLHRNTSTRTRRVTSSTPMTGTMAHQASNSRVSRATVITTMPRRLMEDNNQELSFNSRRTPINGARWTTMRRLMGLPLASGLKMMFRTREARVSD